MYFLGQVADVSIGLVGLNDDFLMCTLRPLDFRSFELNHIIFTQKMTVMSCI